MSLAVRGRGRLRLRLRLRANPHPNPNPNQLLPPPPSYSLLVSRFLLLWSATLPFPMLSVLPRWCVT